MREKLETLDPENWQELKELGYRMIDDIVYSLQNDTENRFEFPSEEIAQAICVPLSEEGEGEKETYEAFTKYIGPYSMGRMFMRRNY